MGIKVTEMTEATQVNNNDLFMIVQNGENKKITKETLQDSIVDAELEERVDTLEDNVEDLQDEVEALQEENLYLNNLVEQAFDKKEVEGEEISIDDTINAKMEVGLEGNTTQETTTGKNLLQNKLTSGTYNGITYVVNEDKSVTLSGTASAVTWLMLNNSITLEAGTYTVSSGINSNIIRLYCDTMGGYISNGIKTTTLTETKTSDISINIPNGTAITTPITIYPMVEKSSTKTDYEKYTGGVASPNPSYPSNVHKVTGDNTIVVNGPQILNINDVPSTTKNGITYSANDNVVILNGTSTANTFIKLELNRLIPSGKTISYSANNSKINNNVSIRPANNGSALEVLSLDAVNKTRNNYTLPNDMNEIYIVVNNGTSLSNFEIKLMANIGTTALPYEEHQEQTFQINLGNIEVCGIEDYRDYFYKSKSNNKWYLHKEIGKVVLDGSEPEFWSKSGSSTENYFVGALNLSVTGITAKFGTTSQWLCDKLISGNLGTENTFSAYNGNTTTGYTFLGVTISSSLANDINAFKTWLSNNNVTLYYILLTPTDTEITDTTLISQLEALKTAMSYAGQTNISQINNDAPFILQVTALASYNSRILALENAILNANRSTPTEQLRKSNEIIEEPKEEVTEKEEVEEPKEEIKEER